MFYKKVSKEEMSKGVKVEYVGVYVLKWPTSIATNGFVEVEDKELREYLKEKDMHYEEGDEVIVSSAVKGAPDEIHNVIMGKKEHLILDDDVGTRLIDLNPEAIDLAN